jgi:hypothetical protein
MINRAKRPDNMKAANYFKNSNSSINSNSIFPIPNTIYIRDQQDDIKLNCTKPSGAYDTSH